MSTIPIPADLVDGQTAFAGHVTPLYNGVNGNLDDANMKTNGVDAKVLRDATLDTGAKGFDNNITPAKMVLASSGSIIQGAGSSAGGTVTHNRGRQPIVGASASAAGDGAGNGEVHALTAVGANTFTIGVSGTALTTVGGAINSTVFYTYF